MSDHSSEQPIYPPAYPQGAYPTPAYPTTPYGVPPTGRPFGPQFDPQQFGPQPFGSQPFGPQPFGPQPGQQFGPPPFAGGSGSGATGPDGQRPAGGRRTLLTAVAVAALVGGGVGAGTVALVDDTSTVVSSAGLQVSAQTAPAAKLDGTVSAAAAKIRPSVVTINVVGQQEEGTGSGVIIRKDGYILTNDHVVDSGGSITVTLADGRRAPASVVGRDASDDLAVVKVKLSGLTAATFASSAKLVVGQTVVAVGAPLGLSDTVTSGIVSSTARPVRTGTATKGAVFNAVQTDAAINPGNSGGPLVDLNGNVVGINAAIATDPSQGGLQVPGSQSGNIGIGFAIPSDEANRIATELIATGKATHAIMGVTVRDAGGSQSQVSDVGASVQSVTKGSPAAKAGFKVGDVITQVGAQRIDNADALVAAIRSHAPGETVSIAYVRGANDRSVKVTLVSSAN